VKKLRLCSKNFNKVLNNTSSPKIMLIIINNEVVKHLANLIPDNILIAST
jgi:hypothetical protein